MTPTLMTVIHMALLTWLTLLGGSLLRERAWTREGVAVAFTGDAAVRPATVRQRIRLVSAFAVISVRYS